MTTAHEYLVPLLTDKFEISPASAKGDATLAEIGLDSLAAAELHRSMARPLPRPTSTSTSTSNSTRERIAATPRTR
ncbi:acyl carrier protein [Streptomyces sp. ET3-23]|uniref:acyl carrier protein n=1 Tax=Streptomyces sp. ET3-23 TaxID=2885643 RepID=UPI001D10BE55|nr:acyl carrier protein [Streptomyces sp. ET3-23]MCC2280502.1 acyl carrier protein [Streptomyces sp. ET3-23]